MDKEFSDLERTSDKDFRDFEESLKPKTLEGLVEHWGDCIKYYRSQARAIREEGHDVDGSVIYERIANVRENCLNDLKNIMEKMKQRPLIKKSEKYGFYYYADAGEVAEGFADLLKNEGKFCCDCGKDVSNSRKKYKSSAGRYLCNSCYTNLLPIH